MTGSPLAATPECDRERGLVNRLVILADPAEALAELEAIVGFPLGS